MITEEYLALLSTNPIHESFEQMEREEEDPMKHFEVWAWFRDTHCMYKPHHSLVGWWESFAWDGSVIGQYADLEMAALVSYIDYEKHGFRITAWDALGFAAAKMWAEAGE